MPFKTTFLLLAILVSSFAFFNSGCSGKTESGFGSVDIPSTAPDAPPDDDDGGSPGDGLAEINANYFWAGLAPDEQMLGYTHSVTGFGDICGINKTATSSQDVECILEVPEGELHGIDLNITYNVPAGTVPGNSMCRYLVRRPYWFYDKEVGIGPINIQVSVVQSTDSSATTRTCNVDGDIVNCANAELTTEAKFTFDDGDRATPGCVYGSCCFGKYTFSQTITDVSGDTTVATAPTSGDWSGSVSSCLGGAGKTNWSMRSPSGFPNGEQTYTGNGLNGKYTVNSLGNQADMTYQNTRQIANYYTPALQTHTGFLDARISSVPYFVDPIDDRNGTTLWNGLPNILPEGGLRIGNDSYTFECLDSGHELVHRIRLYVREWNTMEEYIKYVVSEGTDGDPDVNGADGVDCEGSDSTSSDCNDYYSIDDLLNVQWGLPSYDTSGPITERAKYFPADR